MTARRAATRLLLAGVAGLAAGASSGESPPAEVARGFLGTRWVMGTELTIDVRHLPAAPATRAAEEGFEEVQRLDNLLSNWLDYTPLSRLNASAGEGPVAADPELIAYLRRARRDAVRTDGNFDVTVGALIQAHRNSSDPDGIEEARALVGISRLTITDRTVTLPAGFALDPGGDGKGLAVDAVVERLSAHGVTTGFVNFGGSSFFGMGVPGTDPVARGWPVAIAGPDGIPLGTVYLRDRALSSSCSRVTDADGSTRAHIVNPETGDLVREIRTAVVLSPSATDAEVLSTALVVAGEAGTGWLARFEGAEFAIFTPDRDPVMTPGFTEVYAPPSP